MGGGRITQTILIMVHVWINYQKQHCYTTTIATLAILATRHDHLKQHSTPVTMFRNNSSYNSSYNTTNSNNTGYNTTNSNNTGYNTTK